MSNEEFQQRIARISASRGEGRPVAASPPEKSREAKVHLRPPLARAGAIGVIIVAIQLAGVELLRQLYGAAPRGVDLKAWYFAQAEADPGAMGLVAALLVSLGGVVFWGNLLLRTVFGRWGWGHAGVYLLCSACVAVGYGVYMIASS